MKTFGGNEMTDYRQGISCPQSRRWWLQTKLCNHADGHAPVETHVPWWAWPFELIYRARFNSTRSKSPRKKFAWIVNMPDITGANGEIHLMHGDQKIAVLATDMDISLSARYPSKIHLSVIPRELEALIAFSEKNPTVIDVHWPLCPHCGMLYNETSTAEGES